ncbi:MAG TPA: ParB N-terminal domain-containing protein [Jatrophihabitans sp.]|jgi:ParB family chromosome partitioning protein|uniref:ParB/RepB/Spo0J family partition protein n=1 Tax=Jatrophihabitans sp. TaxID=1932789 RepID=UPI002F082CA3
MPSRTNTAPTQAAAQPDPSSAATATAETFEGRSELVHLDPRTLLITDNIRRKGDLTDEFVASIRQHGVLVPIVALSTSQGAQVRYGQRRTLAAIEACRPTVPVMLLTGEIGEDLDRIVEQWHENEHRTGLSVSDQAAAAEQLAAFGLSAEMISKRLRTPKRRIDRALQVAKSELASKSADRYDLTLEQAAVLAEFEKDTETVTALIAAARKGPVSFEHVAQVARDARARAELIATAEAKLDKANVRRITSQEAKQTGTSALNDLTNGTDRDPIKPTQHKKCPGHAAYVSENWRGVETVYVCTDWRKHGHKNRWASSASLSSTPSAPMTATEADALTEQARTERRRVIDNNKAWASAEKVRRTWLKSYLTRKTPQKGTTTYIAAELAHGDHALRRAMESLSMLPELLGCKGRLDLAATADTTSEGRGQVIALGIILAAMESSVTREAWRTPQPAAKRYFRFLATIGYELSDVEQLVLNKPRTRRPADSPAAVATVAGAAPLEDQSAGVPAGDQAVA